MDGASSPKKKKNESHGDNDTPTDKHIDLDQVLGKLKTRFVCFTSYLKCGYKLFKMGGVLEKDVYSFKRFFLTYRRQKTPSSQP